MYTTLKKTLPIFLITAACAGAPAQTSLPMVFRPDRPEPVGLSSASFQFTFDHTNEGVDIMVEQHPDNRLNVRARSPSIDWGDITLSYPHSYSLETSDIYIGQSEWPEGSGLSAILIIIEYGETRRCFSNSSGRNYWSLYLYSNEGSETYNTDIRNCRGKTELIQSQLR